MGQEEEALHLVEELRKKHGSDFSYLNTQLKDSIKHNREDHAIINRTMESQNKSKVSGVMFRWVIGLLITFIVFILGVIGHVGFSNRAVMNRHIFFAEFLYGQITGGDWNNISRRELLKARKGFEESQKQLRIKESAQDDEIHK